MYTMCQSWQGIQLVSCNEPCAYSEPAHYSGFDFGFLLWLVTSGWCWWACIWVLLWSWLVFAALTSDCCRWQLWACTWALLWSWLVFAALTGNCCRWQLWACTWALLWSWLVFAALTGDCCRCHLLACTWALLWWLAVDDGRACYWAI